MDIYVVSTSTFAATHNHIHVVLYMCNVFVGYVSGHGNAKSKAIGNSDIAKLSSPEVMTIFTPTCNVKV